MSGEAFFDTNILIYAVSDDPKATRARALLETGGGVAIQALNEFVAVSRRKLAWSWPEVVAALAAFRVLLGAATPLTDAVHQRGVAIAATHGFSFYDSLMIAAALEADAGTLWSEDLQDGREIDALTIRNPFV